MDISGLGASKLLEALEKLGVSKGAELRSLGPQGEPPAELVRAFEDALRAPDGQGGPSVQGVAEGSREHGPFEEAGQDIPEVARTDEAIPPNPSEDPVYGISEGSRIDGIGGTMRIESPSGPQAVGPPHKYHFKPRSGVPGEGSTGFRKHGRAFKGA